MLRLAVFTATPRQVHVTAHSRMASLLASRPPPAKSTRACFLSQKLAGSEIKDTSSSSANALASYAVGSPRILTTFNSPSGERSDARSAMNLLSPFAGLTTARCIALLTKVVGGDRRALTRSPQRKSCGATPIPSQTMAAANSSRLV